MSRDKHKKRDRAYALIRAMRHRWFDPPHVNRWPAMVTFSGPPSRLMRWMVKKGMATISRSRAGSLHRGPRSRHNVFDAEVRDEKS